MRPIILLMLSLLFLLPSVTAQEEAPTQQTHVIQRGETLNSITRRYNTTIEALAQENNIANPSQIYWGQTLRIPSAATPAPTAPPPTPTLEPSAAITTLEYGVHANLSGRDLVTLSQHADDLGADWVRQVIYWRDLEPAAGEIDFTALDALVTAFEEYNILLTITAAPDWARTILEESGPPDDFNTYSNFISALATRYTGRIDAYQIWDEPNLRSRWKSTVHPISAEAYVNLLQAGYTAIKQADPDALVITAGLAPTGYNDARNAEAGNLEINAIDDRVFLQDMYALGAGNFSDAIGVHPIGWANPPDARCCTASDGVETHYEDPHFYFLETLIAYRDIQKRNGAENTPLWITKFGWGSSEDLGIVDPTYNFIAYTSLAQQATYAQRAFILARELGYVGPMFIYNLNDCLAPGDDLSGCYYSLLGPDGNPRPVFNAIRETISTAPAPQPISTATPADIESTPEAVG